MAKHDLRRYKEALLVKKHILEILKVTDACHDALRPFKRYLYVSQILSTIEEQETLFEIALNKAEKIIREKGKVDR